MGSILKDFGDNLTKKYKQICEWGIENALKFGNFTNETIENNQEGP